MNIALVANEDPGAVLSTYSQSINLYTNHCSVCLIDKDSHGYSDKSSDDIVFKKIKFAKKNEPEGPISRVRLLEATLDSADLIVVRHNTTMVGGTRIIRYMKKHSSRKIAIFVDDVRCLSDMNMFDIYRRDFLFLTTQGSIYREFKRWGYLNVAFIPIMIPEFVGDNFVTPTNQVILSHSTKDRKNKNTESFIKVGSYLVNEYDNIDFSIIENCSYIESIDRKRASNIGVDHIHPEFYYYGISSVENSALGLINFVYLDIRDREILQDFLEVDKIPWCFVENEGQLHADISAYIQTPQMLFYDRMMVKGWYMRFWNNKKVIQKIVKIFERYL